MNEPAAARVPKYMSEARRAWLEELREIDQRGYQHLLDSTRAAVLRSCIRWAEIEEERDAANNQMGR